MTYAAIDLTPRIGTEIRSDAATLLSGKHADDLRDLLERRGVLVFRELNFTEEEQKIFSQTLGKLMLQLGQEVLKVSLDPKINGTMADYQRGVFYWHIDTATDDVPTRASLLTSRKLSPTGGETEFANTYAAYEDLPEADKQALKKTRVAHSVESSQLYVRPEPTLDELMTWRKLRASKVHPLVWTHKSGRKSLLLGATASHVEGMSLEDGRALLIRLREWATQPQFVYQHKWKLGDLVMWDNTGTIHRVCAYPLDCGRLMIRTALMGEEAVV